MGQRSLSQALTTAPVVEQAMCVGQAESFMTNSSFAI